MDSTHEYVEKLHKRQEKAEQNKQRQAKENQSRKLPNKQHNQGF